MHKVPGGWPCLCKAAGSPRFAPRVTPCSIRDIGSLVVPVWNMEAGVVGGESFSLDNIEDDYLTSYFHDGRVHGGTSSSRVIVHAPGLGSHRPGCVVGTGMNCASLSCPHLRRRAYTGANLNQELTDQVLSGKRVHRPVRTMLPHRCRPQMESWLQNTQLALNLDRTNNELSLNKVQLDLCCARACRVCV